MATATLRNPGKGDLPHQLRPARQQAWHGVRAAPLASGCRGGQDPPPHSTVQGRDRAYGWELGRDVRGGTCPPQSPVVHPVGRVPPVEGRVWQCTTGTSPCPEPPAIAPARAGVWLMGLRAKLSLHSKALTGQKSGAILRSAGCKAEGCANQLITEG